MTPSPHPPAASPEVCLTNGCWILDVGSWLKTLREAHPSTNIQHPTSNIRPHNIRPQAACIFSRFQSTSLRNFYRRPVMKKKISLTINGKRYQDEVEPRLLLIHYLREVAGLTGPHIGSDTSICGPCTVECDGKAAKSYAMFAVH